jgi:hypothetical protein
MGTRRKTAKRGFVEIADAGGAEGVAGGGLRGGDVGTSYSLNVIRKWDSFRVVFGG